MDVAQASDLVCAVIGFQRVMLAVTVVKSR